MLRLPLAAAMLHCAAAARPPMSSRDFFHLRNGADAVPPLYMHASAPIDDRVADLLSQMTIDEKVAQTLVMTFDSDADVLQTVAQAYGNTSCGVVYSGTQGPSVAQPNYCNNNANLTCVAERQNQMQSSMLASSRLHIPISIVSETLHGAINYGVIFPSPVLLGHSWNPDLVNSVASAIATEARIAGIDRGYAPVLQSTTDPRFGRIDENYGEDPVLVSVLGSASYTRGMHQGEIGGPDAYLPPNGLVSEAKHFAAYGYAGRDAYPADISDNALFEAYMPQWREYVVNGGRGIMASHQSVAGTPNHANGRLITDVLRNKFGLVKGFVATDYHDVEQLLDFNIVPDLAGCAQAAIMAGVDNDLASFNQSAFGPNMANLVNTGVVPSDYLDRAVANTLRAKFAAGLFDGGWYVNASQLDQLDSPQHRALARTAAQEGITLVQNTANMLPLDLSSATSIRSVAVVGQNGGCLASEPQDNCPAVRATNGGYTNLGAYTVTVLEGLQNAAKAAGGVFSVNFAVGAYPDVYNTSGIPAAVAAAQASDVTVAVLGDSACGYGCGTCAEGVDADDLDLPGGQMDLLYALATAQPPLKKLVLVLVNGRPATFGAGMGNRWAPLNTLLNKVGAVVVAWRPGEEGGNAVADVLGGAVNPSGKLTHTWPRSVGQVKQTGPYYQRWFELKAYYSPDRTIPDTPLFPFGWGLSYSTFTVGAPQLNTPVLSNADLRANVSVTVQVTNTAGPAGKLAVQLYFKVGCCTKKSPYQQKMAGFAKALVPAGGTVPVTITFPLINLAQWDSDVDDYVVFPVNYTLWVAQYATEAVNDKVLLTVTG